MATRRVSCPRCLRPADLPAEADFCPHCGLDGLGPHTPVEPLTVGDVAVRVGRRLGVGDACNLYHCTVVQRRQERPGVFKIARDSAANAAVAESSAMLARLIADGPPQLAPFLPTPVTTLGYRTAADGVARQAAVMTYHASVPTPDALYALAEVQQQYPHGVDARDMAWVWRRLLTVLGGVHSQGVVHAAVTPAHVLIEPTGHGLVLIGWSTAAATGAHLAPRTTPYGDWFAGHPLATPAVDLKTAARTMLALLGQHLPVPPAVEPALLRYFDRCMAAPEHVTAPMFLTDFDRLIETLWGPRQFRPFTMPPRQTTEQGDHDG